MFLGWKQAASLGPVPSCTWIARFSPVCLDRLSLFRHLPTQWHLGCCQVLATVNQVATNKVHMQFLLRHKLHYSGIKGCDHRILRQEHAWFQKPSRCAISPSSSIQWRVLLLSVSTTFNVSALDFGHSKSCIIGSGFRRKFLSVPHWIHCHMLVFHPCIFSGSASVPWSAHLFPSHWLLIFGDSPVLIWFTNLSSHPVVCLLVLLTGSDRIFHGAAY